MKLAALLLWPLLGCQPEAPAEPEKQKPAAMRDTFHIAVASEPRDFLSVVSTNAADNAFIEAMSPLPMDPDFDCRITWQPALAQSWVFGPDGRTVTVHLKADQVWEDGAPVTAEDYAFTYALARDPAVGSPYGPMLSRLAPDTPKVLSPTSLEFTFLETYDRTRMLSLLAIPLVPKHVLDTPGLDRARLREHALNHTAPLSAGPFRLAEQHPGKDMTFLPNPAYVGSKQEKSKLRRIVLHVIPAYEERLRALVAGEVDLVEPVEVEDADRISAEHPEILFHRRGWRSLDYVVWNNLDPADYLAQAGGGRPDPAAVAPHAVFGDRAVRRALAAAIDVNQLVAELLTSQADRESYGRPAVGTLPPALCGVHNDAIERIPFDIAAAKAALGAAGWTDTNGDGWADKGGAPLRFTLLTNEGHPRRTRAADLLKATLAQAGVDVVIERVTQEVLLDRLQRRAFDAALTGLTASLYLDPTPLWGKDAPMNFSGYHGEKAAELLARGMAEPDADRARAVWREFQQVVYDDQPVAFLYWMDELVGLHTRFRSPVIDEVAPYRRLHTWSVPIDRVKYVENDPVE